MAKISRATQVIFASGGNVPTGGFGAPAAGNVTTELATSSTLATLQGLAAWAAGWLNAVIGGSKFPVLEDMNAKDYVVTTQLAYLFQQGIPEWDAGTTYYQFGMCIAPNTYQLYGSLGNANLNNNPVSSPSDWTLLCDFSILSGGTFFTGDIKASLAATAPTGWIAMNDGTIGSATSGAGYANANAVNLYELIWNNVSNTYAPVTGGRGANAAADWAANKPLQLTLQLGRAIGGAGAGAGLTAYVLGQNVGENTHLLITAEMPSHSHDMGADVNGSATSSAVSGSGTQYQQGGGSTNTDNTGGGGAHNNMQPTSFYNIFIKL